MFKGTFYLLTSESCTFKRELCTPWDPWQLLHLVARLWNENTDQTKGVGVHPLLACVGVLLNFFFVIRFTFFKSFIAIFNGLVCYL